MINYKFTTIRIVFIAIYTALIYSLQVALSFLPNVELVTFLFLIGALFMPLWAILTVAICFNVLEFVTYGFGDWVVFYMIIWPIFVLLINLVFKKAILKHWWIGVIIMTVFGFAFGTLNTGVWMMFYGVSGAMAYWIAGFSFDLIHGVANMLIGVALIIPVMKVMKSYIPKIFVNKTNIKIETKGLEDGKPTTSTSTRTSTTSTKQQEI
ncbi:hypothetical protein ELUMI_v1c00310 [Williamsoniiplasma luminosum]|uniref:ECF transporter S component n=1 Tax=Williamsoniiplasma luminosum TaxID=214888 RepID=A0A2K8NSE1_9MOLU|nr:hypothetical protein [Williamsoniiplasma luminosum]ATZ16760.1 hypothetical protein ELUMI_v1c00310 [Williamsoniiplasma luminosum]